MPEWMVGVDTGGTFTDLVAFEPSSGKLHTIKVPSLVICRFRVRTSSRSKSIGRRRLCLAWKSRRSCFTADRVIE